MLIPFNFSLWGCYVGPIWDPSGKTRKDSPYCTHVEPGCTHIKSIYICTSTVQKSFDCSVTKTRLSIS